MARNKTKTFRHEVLLEMAPLMGKPGMKQKNAAALATSKVKERHPDKAGDVPSDSTAEKMWRAAKQLVRDGKVSSHDLKKHGGLDRPLRSDVDDAVRAALGEPEPLLHIGIGPENVRFGVEDFDAAVALVREALFKVAAS